MLFGEKLNITLCLILLTYNQMIISLIWSVLFTSCPVWDTIFQRPQQEATMLNN